MERPSEVKVTRIARGLRLIDVELATGIGSSTLSLIERGLKVPTADQVRRLNKILGQRVYDTRIDPNGGAE
ncbi:MAG: helix-turn-helix transcriptional regulator [Deltaproteobacteria bacterium]|nr:helix-turn-helix transcriptional regulator [Deltaproteobacteria bacterium]